MAEQKWSYKLDAPNERGDIPGYTLIKPDGQVGTHVSLNDGAAGRVDVELVAGREVANLNGDPLPRRKGPEPVIRGKKS